MQKPNEQPPAGPRLASYVVIPARLESTRLRRKLLLRETGKTVVQHTYEAASQAREPSGICVAADSEEIAAEVRRFGGSVEMTDPHASSGTDRVIELAARIPDVDIFVNVQGDEPELPPESIDLVIHLLKQTPAAVMSTLAAPIRQWSQVESPNCVKVVMDSAGRALYFSRSPIPHTESRDMALLRSDPPLFWQHIGLYAYRREFLLRLARAPRSRLEELEKLEQLRVLAAGYTIVVGTMAQPPVEIDTWDDYRNFVDRWSVIHAMDQQGQPSAHSSTSR